jgi:hypothetical protein
MTKMAVLGWGIHDGQATPIYKNFTKLTYICRT